MTKEEYKELIEEKLDSGDHDEIPKLVVGDTEGLS